MLSLKYDSQIPVVASISRLSSPFKFCLGIDRKQVIFDIIKLGSNLIFFLPNLQTALYC